MQRSASERRTERVEQESNSVSQARNARVGVSNLQASSALNQIESEVSQLAATDVRILRSLTGANINLSPLP